MCVSWQMPVQSECYHKVKAVCDRLAVLAAQCSEEELEKRFHFLDAVCQSWAQSDSQRKDVRACSVYDAFSAEITEEKLSDQSEVNTVTYSEDSVSVADHEETFFTHGVSKQPGGDCAQSQLGMCELTL